MTSEAVIRSSVVRAHGRTAKRYWATKMAENGEYALAHRLSVEADATELCLKDLNTESTSNDQADDLGKPETFMSKTETPNRVASRALLAAEKTLRALTDQMAAEAQANMSTWPRDWMQKHVNERAAIIKARNILIDRAEAANS